MRLRYKRRPKYVASARESVRPLELPAIDPEDGEVLPPLVREYDDDEEVEVEAQEPSEMEMMLMRPAYDPANQEASQPRNDTNLHSTWQGLPASKRSGARHPIIGRGAAAWEHARTVFVRKSKEWRTPYPRLLTHRVTDKTGKGYMRWFWRFIKFAEEEGEDLSTPSSLDSALTWFMDRLRYHDREGISAGKNVRSAVTTLHPSLKGQLPSTSRALRSWEILEGNVEREPLCQESFGLVMESMSADDPEYGWSAWAQLDTGMREQDLEALLSDDINVGHTGTSLNLGVLERGESTKTGTHQGVTVLEPALQRYFRRKKRTLPRGAKVFKFKIRKYQEAWNRALLKYGWQDLGGVHLLRHCMAVFLLQYFGWTRDKVRERGRWKQDESMIQYTKRHLLHQNEERLSTEQKERGAWLYENLRERTGLPPSPPESDAEEDLATTSAYPYLPPSSGAAVDVASEPPA